jgi:hypothetical protein
MVLASIGISTIIGAVRLISIRFQSEYDRRPGPTSNVWYVRQVIIADARHYAYMSDLPIANSLEEMQCSFIHYVVPDGSVPTYKFHVSYLSLPKVVKDTSSVPVIFVAVETATLPCE